MAGHAVAAWLRARTARRPHAAQPCLPARTSACSGAAATALTRLPQPRLALAGGSAGALRGGGRRRAGGGVRGRGEWATTRPAAHTGEPNRAELPGHTANAAQPHLRLPCSTTRCSALLAACAGRLSSSTCGGRGRERVSWIMRGRGGGGTAGGEAAGVTTHHGPHACAHATGPQLQQHMPHRCSHRAGEQQELGGRDECGRKRLLWRAWIAAGGDLPCLCPAWRQQRPAHAQMHAPRQRAATASASHHKGLFEGHGQHGAARRR
jgi:hypothetical protein